MKPIDVVCKILRRQNIDNQMRIGQVLDIIMREHLTKDGTDPYFVSDEKLVKCMEQYEQQSN